MVRSKIKCILAFKVRNQPRLYRSLKAKRGNDFEAISLGENQENNKKSIKNNNKKNKENVNIGKKDEFL